MTFPLPRLKDADAYNLADITNTEYRVQSKRTRLPSHVSNFNK